jgi:stress response protein YsnF
MKTVVGLFETVAKANEVKAALLKDGYDSSDVNVMDQSKESYTTNYDENDGTAHESVGERIKHFFGSFGEGDNSGHESYTSGVEHGGAIVSVRADDEDASDAADLLHSYGAEDVDDRYSNRSQEEYAAPAGKDAFAGKTTGEGQVIPIVQEELEVGKREVNRGSVRVYSHMVTGSKAIELTAMGEEAVVGKTSRVVEEVVVGKVATERTEQIKDSVRHTEVDVEETPANKDRY